MNNLCDFFHFPQEKQKPVGTPRWLRVFKQGAKDILCPQLREHQECPRGVIKNIIHWGHYFASVATYTSLVDLNFEPVWT